jgi:hypothetical protein
MNEYQVFYLKLIEGMIKRGGNSPMDEGHEEIAQVFLEEYNHTKGRHYEFECLRRSMFSIPDYKLPPSKIYQMAFTEGKKRTHIVTDLMVLLRLQKRLIIEVIELHGREGDVKEGGWPRMVEGIIDPIEIDASSRVACSRYLLIDGRGLGHIRISDPGSYKKQRIQRNETLKNVDKRDLLQASFPPKHWFREIWLSYHDEEGVARCLQIW